MTLYKRQVKHTLYKYHKVGLGSDEIATSGWVDEDEALGPWTWAESTGLHRDDVMLKTIEQFIEVNPEDYKE